MTWLVVLSSPLRPSPPLLVASAEDLGPVPEGLLALPPLVLLPPPLLLLHPHLLQEGGRLLNLGYLNSTTS